MNGLLALLMSLVILGTPWFEGTDEEILARHDAECAAANPGPDCGALRAEIELMLYHDLRLLFRMGAEIDPEVIEVAASASLPQLVLLGLNVMKTQPGTRDEAAILAALENPSPAVRQAAFALLGENTPASVKPLSQWVYFDSSGTDDGTVPDATPDADILGFPPYPGARLVPLASGKSRAFFVTSDAPEKVIATIANGKPVIETFALHERLSALMMPPEYEALMAKMEQLMTEADYDGITALNAEMDELMKTTAPVGELMGDLGQVMANPEARFVVLREKPASRPGGAPSIGRIAAVFYDSGLDGTVILVPLR